MKIDGIGSRQTKLSIVTVIVALLTLLALCVVALRSNHLITGNVPSTASLAQDVVRLRAVESLRQRWEIAKAIVRDRGGNAVWREYGHRKENNLNQEEQLVVIAAYYLGDNRFESDVRLLAEGNGANSEFAKALSTRWKSDQRLPTSLPNPESRPAGPAAHVEGTGSAEQDP